MNTAKVYAMPQAVAENVNPFGEVKACIFVPVTDLHGISRRRKVSLGRISASLNQAQDIARDARTGNDSQEVFVIFTTQL